MLLPSQYSMLTFTISIEDSVREDVATLRKSPFIRQGTQIIGLTYDVEIGQVAMVE